LYKYQYFSKVKKISLKEGEEEKGEKRMWWW